MSAVAEASPAGAVEVGSSTPGPRSVESGPAAKFDSLDEALAHHAGVEPTPKQQAPPKRPEAAKPPPSPPKKPDAQQAKPDAAKPAPGAAEAVPAKAEKWNPVKELKELRPKYMALEAENKRLRESIVPEQERGTITQRMDAIRAENEELRNKIRFKDYESSPEFQDKHHKPYVSAISKAMRDLSRIPLVDAAGNQRAATETDLFEIVNLMNSDLGAAKKRAVELFPDFAPEVMSMADKVREIGIQRHEALENERKTGSERVQRETEQTSAQQRAIAKETEEIWSKEVADLINNPKDPELGELLKPKVAPEGQQLTPEETAHNEALEKGYKLVDDAFKFVNEVRQKGLKATKEERSQLARKLAAVRHRAAGFGIARRQTRSLKSKLAAAESELADYKGTAPTNGGRHAPALRAGKAGDSTMDSIMEGVSKYAAR